MQAPAPWAPPPSELNRFSMWLTGPVVILLSQAPNGQNSSEKWAARTRRSTHGAPRYIMRYMYLKCILRGTYLICRIHAAYMRDTCICKGDQDTCWIHPRYIRDTCISNVSLERYVSTTYLRCRIHAGYIRNTCGIHVSSEVIKIHAGYMRDTCGIHLGYMRDTYLGGFVTAPVAVPRARSRYLAPRAQNGSKGPRLFARATN